VEILPLFQKLIGKLAISAVLKKRLEKRDSSEVKNLLMCLSTFYGKRSFPIAEVKSARYFSLGFS
jgi:hypothetical protein